MKRHPLLALLITTVAGLCIAKGFGYLSENFNHSSILVSLGITFLMLSMVSFFGWLLGLAAWLLHKCFRFLDDRQDD